jgi:CRP/FNR family transcriptional regulator, cyclic AMP receptor protein
MPSPGVGSARTMLSPGRAEQSRMGKDWVPVLAGVPLFEGLTRRHLRRIASLARTKRFAAGTRIVRAGDPGNSFYVIIDGSVRVIPPTGKAVIRGAGECFGEMSLLDGAPRSADVSAADEVLTLTIGSAAFAKLLRSEPQISLALLKVLAARLRAAERPRF